MCLVQWMQGEMNQQFQLKNRQLSPLGIHNKFNSNQLGHV